MSHVHRHETCVSKSRDAHFWTSSLRLLAQRLAFVHLDRACTSIDSRLPHTERRERERPKDPRGTGQWWDHGGPWCKYPAVELKLKCGSASPIVSEDFHTDALLSRGIKLIISPQTMIAVQLSNTNKTRNGKLECALFSASCKLPGPGMAIDGLHLHRRAGQPFAARPILQVRHLFVIPGPGSTN